MERFFDLALTHWIAHRANRWIFTGDIGHIPYQDWQVRAQSLGITIVEPITKLQYAPSPIRSEARKILGFNEDERVVTVTVGCTGAGEYLLRAANEAASLLIDKMPGLRMELVCGKGIDSGSLRRTAKPGVHVHDYVRNLHEYMIASDAAVLQSGLTSTMECLMMGVPMIVVPLANHWEQANTARYVSEKFGVRTIDANQVTAKELADALLELLNQSGRPEPHFRGDGHIAAARSIAEVLNL
jgi:UDP-N-acetylglucosamine:LPS N-acetylglucosamine transferase